MFRRGPLFRKGPKARRGRWRGVATPIDTYVALTNGFGGNTQASQRFTGTGITLSSVTVWLRSPVPVGLQLSCDIYAASAGGLPTGVSLASTTTVAFDSGFDPIVFNSFDFAFSGFTPALGTDYCYVIGYDSGIFNGEVDVQTITGGVDGGVFDSFSSAWTKMGSDLRGSANFSSAIGSTSIGASGISGNSTATPARIGRATGSAGVSGSSTSLKGARATSSGAVGASGSAVGSERDFYSATGAVGTTGSATSARKALASTSGAAGLKGSEQSSAARTGSARGAAGVAGSSSSSVTRPPDATSTAVGAVGISGSTTSVAALFTPPVVVDTGGVIGTRLPPRNYKFKTTATGAVGTSGSVRSVAKINPPRDVITPQEVHDLVEKINRAAAAVVEEVEALAELGEVVTPAAVTSARATALSVIGRVQTLARWSLPDAPPAPLPDPEVVPPPAPRPVPPAPPARMAAGSARGTAHSILSGCSTRAEWTPTVAVEDNELDMIVLAFAIADAEEED